MVLLFGVVVGFWLVFFFLAKLEETAFKITFLCVKIIANSLSRRKRGLE